MPLFTTYQYFQFLIKISILQQYKLILNTKTPLIVKNVYTTLLGEESKTNQKLHKFGLIEFYVPDGCKFNCRRKVITEEVKDYTISTESWLKSFYLLMDLEV